MPIITSEINKINVASTAYYDNPSLKKINPSDCVDMPCDAKKKALIIDTDGSLTGKHSWYPYKLLLGGPMSGDI